MTRTFVPPARLPRLTAAALLLGGVLSAAAQPPPQPPPGTPPGGLPGGVPGVQPGGVPGGVPGVRPGGVPGMQPGGQPGMQPGMPREMPVILVVRLPAGAKLEIEDTPTKSTGEVRTYRSPPLAPGKNYTYSLKATWKEGDKDMVRERTVPVHAGEVVNVDLRQESSTKDGDMKQNGAKKDELPKKDKDIPKKDDLFPKDDTKKDIPKKDDPIKKDG
jgi:uncharacterized protein (TIGR03000 family)